MTALGKDKIRPIGRILQYAPAAVAFSLRYLFGAKGSLKVLLLQD